MQSGDFHQKLRAAWRFLDEVLALARTASSLYSLKVDEGFNRVALDPESTYRDIYLTATGRSYYNFMLSDFAVLQFSWESSTSWRLAYLPNPWVSGVAGAEGQIATWESLESLGGADDEIVSGLISELPYFGSVPPVRFEYAVNQYKEISHPAAHLHIGRHTENRWPVARVLNPLTFTMLISKMYYSEVWSEFSIYYGAGGPGCVDASFISELKDSQLVHDFTATERSSLHFGSQ